MEKIDFVQTWVDGGDAKWRKTRLECEAAERGLLPGDANANADCRYRDNGLLKYWFRAVEKFAPWVNRVFLVTCGQKPDWLDESCPRLRLVSHADYIPPEWLPTFHSNTIELNLHRIQELSERFVIFNDDLFLLRPTPPEFFFRGGLPVIPCSLALPDWLGSSNISRIALNNSGIIKLAMHVERQIWKNWRKFFDVKSLGIVRAAQNLASIAVNRTVLHGTFGHLAQPHLKSTFEEFWRRFPAVLERTSRHKFRADDCVNQWLASAWDMTAGRFQPANDKRMGRHVALNANNLAEICETIRNQRITELCLNDSSATGDIDHFLAEITKAFEQILPDKSSFEK